MPPSPLIAPHFDGGRARPDSRHRTAKRVRGIGGGHAASTPGRIQRTRRFIRPASALVEPIAAAVGALLGKQAGCICPSGLAFATGTMAYVAVEALIPESQSHGSTDLATMSTIAGFTVMMCLDVGLG